MVPKNAREFSLFSLFVTVFCLFITFRVCFEHVGAHFVVTTSPTMVAVRGRRPSGGNRSPSVSDIIISRTPDRAGPGDGGGEV